MWEFNEILMRNPHTSRTGVHLHPVDLSWDWLLVLAKVIVADEESFLQAGVERVLEQFPQDQLEVLLIYFTAFINTHPASVVSGVADVTYSIWFKVNNVVANFDDFFLWTFETWLPVFRGKTHQSVGALFEHHVNLSVWDAFNANHVVKLQICNSLCLEFDADSIVF